MKHFNVTGMSCSACSARVEKAVSKLEGVDSCSINLLTNSLMVEGEVEDNEIINAIKNAGYGVSIKDNDSAKKINKNGYESEEKLEDTEINKLIKRVFISVGFLAMLMYISMGHNMWGWPVPEFFENNYLANGLTQMLLTIIIMIINQKFFISGFKSLIKKAPNMDTLVALGSGASFIYSTFVLYAMTFVSFDNQHQMHKYLHEFYFESAAMILTLITVGKMLEARSKGKTTDALKGLMNLSPKKALVIRNDKEIEVKIDEVVKGDVFIVKPGESVAVDGVVIEGSSAIDESVLTGESIPVDKNLGSIVSAGTINQSGYLKCEATKVGEDTTLSQIIKMVNEASATKAPIAKIADKVSGVFVPIVIAISVLTTVIWLICGYSIGFALARGISVLVISCPCALGLATPVAIMVGNGIGAKNGIMFKTAASLEETGKVTVVVLDKTGTVTKGAPTVTDVITYNGYDKEELLISAYVLEKRSEHPLAKAIIDYCENNEKINNCCLEAEEFNSMPGNGIAAKINNENYYAGNLKFIEGKTEIAKSIVGDMENLAKVGKTPLFFVKNDKLMGIVAVADVIKDDSANAINELKDMGMRVVMLTGDNEYTANAIGKEAGVNEVIAGVLPDGKESVISSLKKNGKVAMVGDGINDAPALTSADVGIAIGAGTDIAIDAADVVLMKSRLSDVATAIKLSKETLKNIKQNLFWAFIYNIIGIPLAAGIWYPLLGLKLNPMFGAAAMSLSSFCVVSNALRLNLICKKKLIKNEE
ncbi:MAG: copper-translocating P-type ATPase [Lachnospiraceae bacterium]|nr:copper-translocating P-type ATPase [Lachnospiraceae bacterium]